MSRSSNLPVPAGQPYPAPREASTRNGNAGPYDAQILGQGGAKRGLKGGPPVLDAARTAYLGVEYSGEADRRPPAGLLMRSKI